MDLVVEISVCGCLVIDLVERGADIPLDSRMERHLWQTLAVESEPLGLSIPAASLTQP